MTAQTTRFNYLQPQNQSALTQTLLSMITDGSSFMQQIKGPMQNVTGSYNISAHLCLPSASAQPKSVQFLTHGVGFDGYYWDLINGNSYVDGAALYGQATFFYDRIGVGQSSKPDPIQTVQTSLDVQIANMLIQKLRTGGMFGSYKFDQVVGVGHSYGSIVTEAVAAKYPKSLDAVILTGFSMNQTGLPPFLMGNDFGIASQVQPYRFSDLPNGYIYPSGPSALQQAFLHYPGFNPLLLAEVSTQQGGVATLGQFFTQNAVTQPAANFTGPVAIVNGAEDLPFCTGNCTYPSDKTAAPLKMLFPHACNTTSMNVPDSGHGINLQYNALNAYVFINQFLLDNGIAGKAPAGM